MAGIRPASLKRSADKTVLSVIELAFSFEDLLESNAADNHTCDGQGGSEVVAQVRVDQKADCSEAHQPNPELLGLAVGLLCKRALNVGELSALSSLGGCQIVKAARGK